MVIGDMMLDQYTWGDVCRISPEGPIPILRVEKEEFRLGGAANVAAHIKKLDCEVYPVGITGTGVSGKKLIQILEDLKVSAEGIVTDESFKTIVKKRVLTDQQQLIRIDYEKAEINSANFEPRLRDKIKRFLPKMDAIIISDYAKGVFNRELLQFIINEAKQIPVICDPGNGIDYEWYQGVTTIKPNRHESEQATRIELKDQQSILEAAAILRSKCQADFISLSLDKDGILFYRDSEDYRLIETDAREVFDVAGAGDTMISVIAVLLANGINPEDAIHMANVAAKIELSYMGVVTIPWSRILTYLTNDGLKQKITTLDLLVEELAENGDIPTVFTNGYFDPLSSGHLRFLLEAAKIPGRLVVAINSDQSITRQKGHEPLLNEKDRSRLLASLESIYRVIVFDESDASALIRRITPKIVVKGERFKDQLLPEQNAIEEVGASIKYLPHFTP